MRPRSNVRAMLKPKHVPREKIAAALRCLILITVFTMTRLQPEPRSMAFDAVVMAGAAYVLITTFIPWGRWDTRRATLGLLALDVMLITALIYTQSGVRSEYYLLYYLPILNASVRLNLRDAAGTCALAAVSYLFVGVLERPEADITTSVISRVLTFSTSAALLAGFFLLLSRERRAFDQLTRHYESATKAKSEFLSQVSHEFRTPLTAIVGFSQLLYEHEKELDPSRQHEYLTVIREQSQQLARMIEDMLDITRMDDNRLELRQGAHKLLEVVESAMMLLDNASDRQRVNVTVEAGTPLIWVDRNEMEQVLSRIVHSALTSSEDGGSVSLWGGPSPNEKGEVQITVRARGLDVEEEDLQVVFGPSAAVLTERPSSGRALGLAVARALVEMHGGRIWVEDTDGEGAAISLTVPKYVPKEGEPNIIVSVDGSVEQGAEAYVEGESDDSGRRSVRTKAGAGHPEALG
ncbi:MAG TPA: HAMP domain-containing sensor histidine kinase [Armatimonadota bacterium]|nr:HAMP domain-containing sensor histidine kinase [Armatimonadota bacterium]